MKAYLTSLEKFSLRDVIARLNKRIEATATVKDYYVSVLKL